MNRMRRAVSVLSATGLALAGLVLAGGPAQANIGCGAVITQSTTLTHDVGPCAGNGLVVQGSGITLNLGGRRVFGATPNAPAENVGILLQNATGVTVQNGTVEGFDAGVAIEGGSGNVVRAVTARNNINDLSANRQNAGDPNNCIYGDGITTFNSDNNRIDGNVVTNNGPISGIALVGDSDGNQVRGNQVVNNNVPNFVGDPRQAACGIPFARPYQDIGIRIEGPGANNNYVDGNTVTGNMLDGITIHGYVCRPPGGLPPQDPNTGNFIRGNNVSGNGFGDPTGPQDGIGILQQGPLNIVCVSFGNSILGNTSTGNARHGVFLGGGFGPAGVVTGGNTVNGNVVNNNGRAVPGDGIRVGEVHYPGPNETHPPQFRYSQNNTLIGNRGTGNSEHDGDDQNPNCDANRWSGNQFGTVNQACVAAGGSGTVTPPPPPPPPSP